MRPHTRILYSLCDRITGEARGARQEDTGLTRRGLSTPPRKRARWGPRLCRDIKGRAWLSPCLVRPGAGPHLSQDAAYVHGNAATDLALRCQGPAEDAPNTSLPSA